MIVVPFKPEHLHTLNLQASQALFGPLLYDKEYGEMLETAGPAFSGIVDGETIISAGIINQWHNRGVAWALVSENAGKNFIAIHKAIDRFLDMNETKRVETYVDDGFEQGYRWMNMLGFEYEGRMRAYSPDGRDCLLYARVK